MRPGARGAPARRGCSGRAWCCERRERIGNCGCDAAGGGYDDVGTPPTTSGPAGSDGLRRARTPAASTMVEPYGMWAALIGAAHMCVAIGLHVVIVILWQGADALAEHLA